MRTGTAGAAVSRLEPRLCAGRRRTADQGAHLGAGVAEALATAVTPGGAGPVQLTVCRTRAGHSGVSDTPSALREGLTPAGGTEY